MTDAFTTRYMYSSPRYLTDDILRWLNLKMFSCERRQCGASPTRLEVTHLHAYSNIFQNLIHNGDRKFWMISLQIIHQCRGIRNVAKLDLPNLGERPQDVIVYLQALSLVAIHGSAQIRRSPRNHPNEVSGRA